MLSSSQASRGRREPTQLKTLPFEGMADWLLRAVCSVDAGEEDWLASVK